MLTYSLFDKAILQIDAILRSKNPNHRLLSKLVVENTVSGDAERRTFVPTLVHEDSNTALTTQFAATVDFGKSYNNYPAYNAHDSAPLSNLERQQSISMMRINHSGEICAQALYQGQALMARNTQQYNSLLEAAAEENNHLNWCKLRLQELNAQPSVLNPLWYAGSFIIGAIAGTAGDQISLGFLAETEHQVTAHLETHLSAMSYKDQRSRSILLQIREDELKHATQAVAAGGIELPGIIKFAMRCTAKIMTITAGKF